MHSCKLKEFFGNTRFILWQFRCSPLLLLLSTYELIRTSKFCWSLRVLLELALMLDPKFHDETLDSTTSTVATKMVNLKCLWMKEMELWIHCTSSGWLQDQVTVWLHWSNSSQSPMVEQTGMMVDEALLVVQNSPRLVSQPLGWEERGYSCHDHANFCRTFYTVIYRHKSALNSKLSSKLRDQPVFDQDRCMHFNSLHDSGNWN